MGTQGKKLDSVHYPYGKQILDSEGRAGVVMLILGVLFLPIGIGVLFLLWGAWLVFVGYVTVGCHCKECCLECGGRPREDGYCDNKHKQDKAYDRGRFIGWWNHEGCSDSDDEKVVIYNQHDKPIGYFKKKN